MHYNADLIILDEPTAALAVAEVRKVLDFVRRIKAAGRACIYIEHNLAHVHEVADRLVVLDRGEIVLEIEAPDERRRSHRISHLPAPGQPALRRLGGRASSPAIFAQPQTRALRGARGKWRARSPALPGITA